MEVVSPPGEGANPHTHQDADEQFYVLAGTGTFLVGGETYHVVPGDVVYIPRGTLHSFKAEAAPMRMLATFTPGGIEAAFLAGSTPITD
jgi:quercetin dioxygenase-like cupin family protein